MSYFYLLASPLETLQAFWCENYSQDAIIISGFSCFACYLGDLVYGRAIAAFSFSQQCNDVVYTESNLQLR